ncbi:MAG: DUF2029 domain-containing protein [Flavobacteriales bacterium]|nr:DUF2029 domain-containing protein [Flavobacteriales bacterium]
MQDLRPFRAFALVVVLLAVASLLLDHLNGRLWLNDFRVYYMAADHLRHGLPVYNEVFGEDTGLYKYAPVVLYFFLPYTYLPFEVAGAIHCLVIGVLLTVCFVVVERSLQRIVPGLPRTGPRAFLGLLCIVVLLARELHLGNINAGLILLAAAGVERLLAGNRRTAGFLWGVVWLVKPYLLLMIVPLVVRREGQVLRTAAISLAIGLALPVLVQGPSTGWALTRTWVGSMQYHTQVMFSPDHLGAMLSSYTGMASSTLMDAGIIAVAGLLLCALTWRNTRREAVGNGPLRDRAFELWLAMALVPNLVITDQQHFMFALPLVLFILAHLFTRRDPMVLALFLLAMLLYATRSSDLWGSALEDRLMGWGVLGMGNILLMGVALLAWRRGAATGGNIR